MRRGGKSPRQRDLFDGSTYRPCRDEGRLFAQLRDVRAYLADGLWHTLPDIAAGTRHPEASISARIRDLRKDRWGSHTVEREFLRRGLFRYRLVLPAPMPVQEAPHAPDNSSAAR